MVEKIQVEVAYATPESQKILTIDVELGSSALLAVEQSGITGLYPEIDLSSVAMGIFGNALGARGLPSAADYVLKAGDRVEIYRPLIADPKEVRKRRAAEAAEKRAAEKSAK